MKYEVKVTIDRPIQEVVKKFDSAENLKKWQPSLQSFEHIEGNPGEKGAKSLLTYNERGRKVEMIETIVENNLPEVFETVYEAKNVKNNVRARFVEKTPNQTIWINENTFHFKGIMKVMGFFMKSAFPKQSIKDMNKFKAFVESSNSENP